MRKNPAARTLWGLTLGAFLCLPATQAFADSPACAGDGVVAQVVSLGGAAWAQAPGEERRALTCDDVVRSCETVITAPGGRVGLLSQDVYALLGADTQARLGKQDDEASQLFLDGGLVRLLDARSDDEARLFVHTRDASLRATRADAEVSLRTRVAGPYTRVCAHDGNVGVSPHGGAPVVAGTSSCAETDRAGAQVVALQAPEIEVVSPLDCGLPPVADRFDPLDVAAGAIGNGFPSVDVASNSGRRPCDATGVCGGLPPMPPPMTPPPGPPPVTTSTPTPVVIVPPPISVCGAPGFPCN